MTIRIKPIDKDNWKSRIKDTGSLPNKSMTRRIVYANEATATQAGIVILP